MSATAPKLRLDRSRYFAEVHGQRVPGDKHQFVHFIQDGIHFDASGLHLDDLVEDDDTRALVDRRLKKQVKAAKGGEAGGGGGDNSDPGSKDSGSESGDVNLEAWLRGEARYDWFKITKAARDRYQVNKTKQADMVDCLVNEVKLVPRDQVAPDLLALIPE